jgi:adenylate kinase
MLRASVKAGTVVGMRAKDIMARGELVPDEMVVAIVADRIAEPDARNGFILDGFPRTVPQAVALDKMLKEKDLKLDGVIELKVDGGILQSRIENRLREAAARGESLRPDDDPDVLKRRIDAYKEQTAPLVDYYRWQGTLKSVDGMEPIDEVEASIQRALAERPVRKSVPKEKSPRAAPAAKAAAKPSRAAAKSKSKVKPKAPSKARSTARRAKSAAGKGKGRGSRKVAARGARGQSPKRSKAAPRKSKR